MSINKDCIYRGIYIAYILIYSKMLCKTIVHLFILAVALTNINEMLLSFVLLVNVKMFIIPACVQKKY